MSNINTTRKTTDCFEIWSNYGYGPEFTTAAENRQEAKRLLAEYRANQPQYHHWIKKERVKNPDYVPTPFEQIICPVDCKYGAPMGRHNTIPAKRPSERIFDRRAPLDSGGYDKGGAYWGLPANLRVRYTNSLSYVEFYRVCDTPKY